MRLYQVRFSSHLVKKFRTIWEHSFSPDTRSLGFGTNENVSFISPSNENLNSLKHVCQETALFPEFSPVGKEDPSHSSGSALPLGVPRLRSSPRGHLGFHQNVVSSKHLDSSRLMYQMNNNRPPSSTRSSYSNTGRPLEDFTNHTTGRISQDCRRRRTNGDQSDGSSLCASVLSSWTTERCFPLREFTFSPFLTACSDTDRRRNNQISARTLQMCGFRAAGKKSPYYGCNIAKGKRVNKPMFCKLWWLYWEKRTLRRKGPKMKVTQSMNMMNI